MITLAQIAVNNCVISRLENRGSIIVFTGLPHHTNIGVIKAIMDEDIAQREVRDVVKQQKKKIEKI